MAVQPTGGFNDPDFPNDERNNGFQRERLNNGVVERLVGLSGKVWTPVA